MPGREDGPAAMVRLTALKDSFLTNSIPGLHGGPEPGGKKCRVQRYTACVCDATIEAAEEHGSTAVASAEVESSFLLHLKINLKNNKQGHFKIVGIQAPRGRPGSSLEAPEHRQNSD